MLGNRVCCRRFREKQISSRPFATPFGGRRRAIQGGRLLAAPVHLREDSTLYRAPLNMRHVDRAYAQAPVCRPGALHRTLSASPADKLPSGSNWIHEIKHDGFRLMVRRDPVGIRLITREGNDWTTRYPLVVEAVNHLKVRSCLIDGEVVCCDEKGVAAFQLLRHRRNERRAFLYAFDLLELNGADLRREPIEVRKATLASILRKSRPGVCLNEHLEHSEGDVVFQHACRMGLEGIVSKRLGSRYRSGPSRDWLKFTNPAAPAATREQLNSVLKWASGMEFGEDE